MWGNTDCAKMRFLRKCGFYGSEWLENVGNGLDRSVGLCQIADWRFLAVTLVTNEYYRKMCTKYVKIISAKPLLVRICRANVKIL
ncbi:MAG: hypothetical protein RSE24_04510 [Oscillospiraceae bacterium]